MEMHILMDNEDITMCYIREVKYPLWEGYFVFVKETEYWYNQVWRWAHVSRMRQAEQVRQLNAGLAQLVSATV